MYEKMEEIKEKKQDFRQLTIETKEVRAQFIDTLTLPHTLSTRPFQHLFGMDEIGLHFCHGPLKGLVFPLQIFVFLGESQVQKYTFLVSIPLFLAG